MGQERPVGSRGTHATSLDGWRLPFISSTLKYRNFSTNQLISSLMRVKGMSIVWYRITSQRPQLISGGGLTGFCRINHARNAGHVGFLILFDVKEDLTIICNIKGEVTVTRLFRVNIMSLQYPYVQSSRFNFRSVETLTRYKGCLPTLNSCCKWDRMWPISSLEG